MLGSIDVGIVEVGPEVAIWNTGSHPIVVLGSEIKLAAYEARQVAELLLRPNVEEIAEQLLKAVSEWENRAGINGE
jgi:hypothetical protein